LLLILIYRAQFNKDLDDHHQMSLVCDIDSVFGYNYCRMAVVRLNILVMTEG
jgi:hypothetical protein